MYMSTLERAIEIAQEAHRGQVDKAGEEYIGHPLRVMEAGRTLEEKIVGLSLDEIAERFGRKRGAIISRMKKLGL